jgi:hypothetical protein
LLFSLNALLEEFFVIFIFLFCHFFTFLSQAPKGQKYTLHNWKRENKNPEMRKHFTELSGSKNIDHSSSGKLQMRSSSSPLLVYCKGKKKKKIRIKQTTLTIALWV